MDGFTSAQFERLGLLYLGGRVEAQDMDTITAPLLYDSKDLTTHAVCVGMTGSGKTGLAVGLLEEAAIDGIPAIAIDPKGDLGNLLLNFPSLEAAEFAPWVDDGAAARGGLTREALAQKTADLWRGGLAKWGQDGARVQRLRDAVDMAVYTPGNSSGRPLRLLDSFAAPDESVLADRSALADHIESLVSGLLGLISVDADPVQSREHVFLSNLLQNLWRDGQSVDLPGLIGKVQSPGFDRVGVIDLETFFPTKDRQQLAIRLNNLLASPGFQDWIEGEPLSVPDLLYTKEGKPRLSILSIAHLDESERMFFVTALLNQVVSWMRGQAGTSSLRALLYMDEIYGYFPPVETPPSKKPMLTLLKQARASGLGVVLSTQNPVDLDYKGLSNAGTWFVGRLQTKQDKARLVEGISSSLRGGSEFALDQVDAMISNLPKRTFLMHSVHEDAPALFKTRWVLSYLRGPLTLRQVVSLAKRDAVRATPEQPTAPAAASTPPAPAANPPRPSAPPTIRAQLPDGVSQEWVAGPAGAEYAATLQARVQLHFVKSAFNIDDWAEVSVSLPMPDEATADWDSAAVGPPATAAAVGAPPAEFPLAELPAVALRARSYASWGKQLKTALYRTQEVTLWRHKRLKLHSGLGESQQDFMARLRLAAREARDDKLVVLRDRYATKLVTEEKRVNRARDKVEREQSQYQQQKLNTAISVGGGLLGALLGNKRVSVRNVGRASTAARGMGRMGREKGDIQRAQAGLVEAQDRYRDLQQEFQDKLADLRDQHDPGLVEPEEIVLRPRKSDISVLELVVRWVPVS